MGWISVIVGVFLAAGVVALTTSVPQKSVRAAGGVLALLVLFAGVGLSSVRYVGADEVGLVRKNALGPRLEGGAIIATAGEMGIQANVLSPGWHFWLWPVLFDVNTVPLIEIPQDMVGLVEARDGLPLEPGQLFAPEVSPEEFRRFINDPVYFLTEGMGRKGPQSNVLTPGKHRINTELFKVSIADAVDVPEAFVAVVGANFGGAPSIERVPVDGGESVILADEGEKGIRAIPLSKGKHPLNPLAFAVTMVFTGETIVRFTANANAGGVVVEDAVSVRGTPRVRELDQRGRVPTSAPAAGASRDAFADRADPRSRTFTSEARPIEVRTSDGFTFPVDVRIEYRIRPQDAPIVVANYGSSSAKVLSKLNSVVRSVFRNNAESVKALDYVNQRSQQERQSLVMIADEMARVGVTINRVSIGDVGNEETLGELLKTQRDREIALQQQVTFQEQQRAAEQRKALTRTEQEAEEERRLATAQYEVQIAEQSKQQRIIAAQAEAESIEIAATAQAEAFRLIAEQIGSGNAAVIELLKVVGERGVNITPSVMVVGDGATPGNGADEAQTAALIGTMLNHLVSDDPRARVTTAE
ncbi:MAG: SPFH domain-containing protein [Planctomycetota bacterium]